jgi:hypothetical protein
MNFKTLSRLPLLRLACAGMALLLTAEARAVPSYARQTGQNCGACHVGSFGPQLTPYGQRFKIGGYTDGDHATVPLSAMLVGTFTHIKEALDEPPARHYKTNDNTAFQEGSVFLAGRLADHLGSFTQATYSGIDRAWTWDNLDIRYAQELNAFNKDLTLGLSLNNNPGIQDPWNTLPAWGYPYIGSDLAPESPAAPLLAGGLETKVLGLNAYAFFDQRWYAELGAYESLDRRTLHRVGLPRDEVTDTAGLSPYARLTYSRDLHRQAYAVGVVAMHSNIRPEPGAQQDSYSDFGIDGSYQFLGNRRNIFTVNGLALVEKQNLGGTFGLGEASHHDQTLRSYNANFSYYRDQTYGASVGFFGVNADHDTLLYGDSRAGRSNTRGEVFQIDYTPFGKDNSWQAPNANLRLGLQYTHYDRYAGRAGNYDGTGRRASDNDTLMVLLWLAM